MSMHKRVTVTYLPSEDEKNVMITLDSDEKLSMHDLKNALDQLIEELDAAIDAEMEKSSNA